MRSLRVLALGLLLAGCSGSSDDGSDATTVELCSDNWDCSGYCERYRDVPADPGASCRPSPPVGTMSITATLRDLVSRGEVEGAEVRAVGAIAAVSNPVAATALAQATTGAGGRLSMQTTDADGEQLGLIALAHADGYFLSGTGLAEPLADSTQYPGSNQIHDLWLVPAAALESWSELLAGDPALSASLPLGERGGIVGLVRDATTGEPIAGAVVRSSNTTTSAVVRYLAEDAQSFSDTATASNGLFVILEPGLAESFQAVAGGVTLGPNLGGTAAKLVFVLVLD